MNRKFSWTASVTALYVILILAVHPIIYQDYYFKISFTVHVPSAC